MLRNATSRDVAERYLRRMLSDDTDQLWRCAQFLTEQGRRKFLKPLYEKLIETEQGKIQAQRIYQQARPTYHAVSRETIDELLK